MFELGELERRAQEFAERGLSITCVSLDSLDRCSEVQRRFPSLTILTDAARREFVDGLGLQITDPYGRQAAAPTNLLVDRQGTVRWAYRAPTIVERLSPDDLLEAAAKHLN